MHLALFHTATRYRFLDRYDDHISNSGGLSFRSAENLDALHPTGAAIVSDIQV
jgi:hypothetical protein